MSDRNLIKQIRNLAYYKVSSKQFIVVVSDIEGCINRSEYVYDYAGISILRRICQLAREDNAIPDISLCSGRQYPFVEAIASMLSVRRSCIFENGAGMYHPNVPLYERVEAAAKVKEFDWGGLGRAALGDILTSDGSSKLEIGKEYTLTLHPLKDISLDEIYLKASECVEKLGLNVTLSMSASALDICPPGIDKGSAIGWLAAKYRVPLSAIGAIGDSDGDLAMLRRSGISGAPSNAKQSVLDFVQYAEGGSDVRGVIDFILHIAEINAEAV